MSYLLTDQAVSQDGVALTMTDGGTIGFTNAIITFDSTNSVCDFNNNIGFATGNGILDSSANEQILFTVTTSAVNYLNVTNAATGNAPALAAAGADANIDLDIDAKATGGINLGANMTGNAPEVKWFGGGSFSVGFSAGSLAGNSSYTWPTAVPASNGYVLSSTTAGVMSWAADASGGLSYNYETSTPVTAVVANIYACNVGAATAVDLPAGAADGDEIWVKDINGDASTNNITISPNGTDTINGGTSLVIDSNYQNVVLIYDSTLTTWGVY